MTSGSIDYIPFQKALVLEGQEEDEELKKELENLQKLVGDRFNNIVHRFDALEVYNCIHPLPLPFSNIFVPISCRAFCKRRQSNEEHSPYININTCILCI